MMTSRLAEHDEFHVLKKSLRKCSPIRSMTYVAASVRSVGPPASWIAGNDLSPGVHRRGGSKHHVARPSSGPVHMSAVRIPRKRKGTPWLTRLSSNATSAIPL